MYCLEPWGTEGSFFAKIVAILLKKGNDWEEFRISESQVFDNKYEQIDVQAARRSLIGRLTAFMHTLVGIQKEQERKQR